jgi:hypothetical protein
MKDFDNWEKEFKDWRTVNLKEEGEDACGAWESYYVDELMAFIHQLLKAQKQELRKKVEGMEVKSDKYDDPMYIAEDEGYNQALSDIINLLKVKKKDET